MSAVSSVKTRLRPPVESTRTWDALARPEKKNSKRAIAKRAGFIEEILEYLSFRWRYFRRIRIGHKLIPGPFPLRQLAPKDPLLHIRCPFFRGKSRWPLCSELNSG